MRTAIHRMAHTFIWSKEEEGESPPLFLAMRGSRRAANVVLVLERVVMGETTFDHERPDAYRFSIRSANDMICCEPSSSPQQAVDWKAAAGCRSPGFKLQGVVHSRLWTGKRQQAAAVQGKTAATEQTAGMMNLLEYS